MSRFSHFRGEQMLLNHFKRVHVPEDCQKVKIEVYDCLFTGVRRRVWAQVVRPVWVQNKRAMDNRFGETKS